MSELHDYKQDSSMTTTILVVIVFLALSYFLAKGCTNSSEHETAPAKHGSKNVTVTGQFL
jgi:heme/copper-type cytochrome/quinol oxidase subunit 2